MTRWLWLAILALAVLFGFWTWMFARIASANACERVTVINSQTGQGVVVRRASK